MNSEARNLLLKLLEDRDAFFDKNNVLNSDGRRLLNKVLKLVLRDRPKLRGVAGKVRRNPTYDNVLRLTKELLEGPADL
ncbi:MAG: hypothetical protein QXX81_03050 [Zestosphaera sp.]